MLVDLSHVSAETMRQAIAALGGAGHLLPFERQGDHRPSPQRPRRRACGCSRPMAAWSWPISIPASSRSATARGRRRGRPRRRGSRRSSRAIRTGGAASSRHGIPPIPKARPRSPTSPIISIISARSPASIMSASARISTAPAASSRRAWKASTAIPLCSPSSPGAAGATRTWPSSPAAICCGRWRGPSRWRTGCGPSRRSTGRSRNWTGRPRRPPTEAAGAGGLKASTVDDVARVVRSARLRGYSSMVEH